MLRERPVSPDMYKKLFDLQKTHLNTVIVTHGMWIGQIITNHI